MNNFEKIYKGNIQKIDTFCKIEEEMEIFYRIVHIDNMYFFAEEISTKTLFPTYFIAADGIDKNAFCLQILSYLSYGKYFVPISVTANSEVGGVYFFWDETQEKSMGCPTKNEIRKYLVQKKINIEFKNKMKQFASENVYWCSMEVIQNKIIGGSKEIEYLENAIDCSFDDGNSNNSSFIDISSIEDFGYNMAFLDNVSEVIGREEEVKKIIQNVAIKNKSVLLVGPSGVGKTSLVEYIAKLTLDNTNKWLKDKMIFYVNSASLVSGTKYRGEFEEKMNRLILFCKLHRGKIILFVDEVHTLFGLGRTENGAIDVINILKPYLSNGDIVMIGATTEREYDKYISLDMAICRRFEKIELTLTDMMQNTRILMNYIEELEHTYQLKFDFSSDEVKIIIHSILEITDLKHQKVGDGVKITNPTFAKSLLEDAIVEAKYNGESCVGIDDICLSVAKCDRLALDTREYWINDLKRKLLLSGRVDKTNKVIVLSRKMN